MKTLLTTLGAACLATQAVAASGNREDLGQQLFLDSRLSTPAGQSCSSCHAPNNAFSDTDRSRPVTPGVIPRRQGNRNAPSTAYAAYSPAFHYDAEEGLYVGGQFWDGRAATLEEQATQPIMNPLEMATPNKRQLVSNLRQAGYAEKFERVYGDDALADVDQAMVYIADALASFQRGPEFAPFSSKYDLYLAGKVELSDSELRGLKVFEAEDKGNCAACHPSRPADDGSPPLFTDFTYDNLGAPRNPDNPFYSQVAEYNPHGDAWVDVGLGNNPQVIADGRAAQERGKVKVPTLRNVAITGPYTHNGYFHTLKGVVDFYNTRDTKPACEDPLTPEAEALEQGCWPAAEVAENVNQDELGDLQLTDQEVDDLAAFLKTLTDGYNAERIQTVSTSAN